MPTISMFYGILIRMFFYDTDKHHKPIYTQSIRGRLRYMRSKMESCYLEICRPKSINLWWRGLR